jgi:hypothetical protein
MSTVAAKPRRWTVGKPTFPSQNLPSFLELRIAGIALHSYALKRLQADSSMLKPGGCLAQSAPRVDQVHRLRS